MTKPGPASYSSETASPASLYLGRRAKLVGFGKENTVAWVGPIFYQQLHHLAPVFLGSQKQWRDLRVRAVTWMHSFTYTCACVQWYGCICLHTRARACSNINAFVYIHVRVRAVVRMHSSTYTCAWPVCYGEGTKCT